MTAPAPGASEDRGSESLLSLAGRLGVASTLTAQVDITLPELARLSSAAVVVFAVAGSSAAGVRCWPADLAWARTVRTALASSWETGPLTVWCRQAGVVAPVRITDVMPGWGKEPGMILPHDGRVLAELLMMPVAVTGPTLAAYFMARYETPFDEIEVARATTAQLVVVASHGRFLRPPEPALTARQHEVLRHLADGRTARAVASQLGISESTVDKHVRDLYARLQTQDRASTVRAAQVRGLLDGLGGEAWQDLLIASSD